MISLKQFVPESVCLSCDGCCRYAERDTVWAPLFLFEEISELTKRDILPSCLFTHPDIHGKKPARIDLIESKDGFVCPCLEIHPVRGKTSETSDGCLRQPASNGVKTNQCKIYQNRPLDCQLYPFLLVAKGQDAFLGVDENCPYVQKALSTPEAKEYIRYLKGFLSSKDFIRLAKSNPEIVQLYTQDIKFLEALPELSARHTQR